MRKGLDTILEAVLVGTCIVAASCSSSNDNGSSGTGRASAQEAGWPSAREAGCPTAKEAAVRARQDARL